MMITVISTVNISNIPFLEKINSAPLLISPFKCHPPFKEANSTPKYYPQSDDDHLNTLI